MILTDSLNSVISMGDLVNVVNVEYLGAFPGTATAANANSIDLYGSRIATKSTTLNQSNEAQSMAADLLTARANPQFSIRSFTIPLHNDAITDPERVDLLQLNMNTALIFPSTLLPEPLKQPSDSINFVEGWTLRAKKNELYLTINQSPRSYTYGHTLWLELDNSLGLTWATYLNSTQWKDA
jgi:hypothetical protein